jgi:hypothetical protein
MIEENLFQESIKKVNKKIEDVDRKVSIFKLSGMKRSKNNYQNIDEIME